MNLRLVHMNALCFSSNDNNNNNNNHWASLRRRQVVFGVEFSILTIKNMVIVTPFMIVTIRRADEAKAEIVTMWL